MRFCFQKNFPNYSQALEIFAKSATNGFCSASIMTSMNVQAGINIFSDFYLLFIPVPVIWKLQLSIPRKIGIIAIFMTGIL